MLPTFYQTHLKSQLNQSEYILLKILIILLQSLKKVRLEALATTLPIPITFASRRKKIQRFLSSPSLTIAKIWLPIVTVWLNTYFVSGEIVYVVIDRSHWSRVNLLMISVVWDKRAFPVYFELLPKLGSSNLDEQKAALSKALMIFKNHKICVLGDREFCSVKLATWLREQGVYFCLRLKKNEFVEVRNEIRCELNDLGLLPGVSFFLTGVKVTKQKGFDGFNVAGLWQRKLLGVTPKEG